MFSFINETELLTELLYSLFLAIPLIFILLSVLHFVFFVYLLFLFFFFTL